MKKNIFKFISAEKFRNQHRLENHQLIRLIENGLQPYSPGGELLSIDYVVDCASSTHSSIIPDWPGLENILFKNDDILKLKLKNENKGLIDVRTPEIKLRKV